MQTHHEGPITTARQHRATGLGRTVPPAHVLARSAAGQIAAMQSLAGNAAVVRAIEGHVQRQDWNDNPLYKPAHHFTDNPLYEPGGLDDERGRDITLPDAAVARQIADRLRAETKQRAWDYTYRGLGGGGASFHRSPEVKQFRAAMKKAARAQAYEDIDTEATGGPGTATYDYQTMVAGNIAHEEAKTTVDAQLAITTGSLLDDLEADLDALRVAARNAAEASFEQKPGRVKDAKAAAKVAAEPHRLRIGQTTWDKKDEVVGKRTGDDEWRLTPPGTAVRDDVIEKVKHDEVGKKSLELAIAAPTMGKALRLLGTALDLAIPGAGETVKLSVEITIPTIPGLSVVIKVAGVAARGIDGATTAGVTTLGNKKRLELSAKFSVGTGADFIGGKTSATLGFLVRSGSDAGTSDAIEALSYAAYRAARPDAFADLWAPEDKKGQASKSPRTKRQRAEMWAAMVEERVLAGGTYGDVGLSLDAGGGVNIVDVAKFEATVGATLFSRYNEESMRAALQKRFAAPVKDDASAESRRAGASGAKLGAFAIGVGAKFEAGGYSVEIAVSASGANAKNWGVEVTAGFGTAGDGAAKAADVIINQMVRGSGDLLKKMRDGLMAAIGEDGKRVGGIAAQLPTDLATIIDGDAHGALRSAIEGIGATQTQEAAFDTAVGQVPRTGADALESTPVLSPKSSIQFAFIFGASNGNPVMRIEVRSVSGIDIGGGSPVTVSASKTTRLFAIGFDEDRIVAEIAGGRLDGGGQ